MEHCNHTLETFNFFGLGEYGLLLSIFLTGLAASFTHCMGMCGPLAMMQANVRLMNIPYDKLDRFSKFKASLTIPYYFGKATSYSIIFLITLLLTSNFRNIVFLNDIIVVLTLLTAFSFIYMGITKNFSLNFPIPFFKNLTKKIVIISNFLKLEPYGFKGYLLGMILGFIPCALVIGIIMTVIASTDSILIGLTATMLFSLSTIPGLFVAPYLGNIAVHNLKNYSSVLFRLLAFFNAYLLFCYALKLL